MGTHLQSLKSNLQSNSTDKRYIMAARQLIRSPALRMSLARNVAATPVRQDIDTAAKFIGAGAGIVTVFGSLIIGYARNPSLKQQLFSCAILGFALSEAMGLFCLMVAFLILFAL